MAKDTITTDQETRLAELEAKLLEVALDECDPDNWTTEESARENALAETEGLDPEAAAALIADAVKGWRGNRYWDKKNGNQTLSMLTRVVALRMKIDERKENGGGSETDPDLVQQMRDAEKEAKKKLRLVKGRKTAA